MVLRIAARRALTYAFIVVACVFFLVQYSSLFGAESGRYVVLQNEPVAVGKRIVYIVGKAAIADYLWQHILQGTMVDLLDGFYKTGYLKTNVFSLSFLSGPGVIQTTLPQSMEYLVLILNGRAADKRKNALEWLNFLITFSQLKKLGVVLLGDEKCVNEWILKYMRRNGGIIDVLFVVYDWKHVNEEDIYQWPLGVATYRGFPVTNEKEWESGDRKNLCNFVGTLYTNSSRSHLHHFTTAEEFPYKCPTIMRKRWLSNETPATLHRYIDVLKNSTFTLCPVGKNTECYRIYEALSFGSIPIVEDVMTEGNCVAPLRLLKKHGAPFIYVKNWKNLNATLNELMKPNLLAKLRHDNIQWYGQFKFNLMNRFVQILDEKFFKQAISTP